MCFSSSSKTYFSDGFLLLIQLLPFLSLKRTALVLSDYIPFKMLFQYSTREHHFKTILRLFVFLLCQNTLVQISTFCISSNRQNTFVTISNCYRPNCIREWCRRIMCLSKCSFNIEQESITSNVTFFLFWYMTYLPIFFLFKLQTVIVQVA